MIIGYNKGWKTNANLGTNTNRICSFPYSKLIGRFQGNVHDKIEDIEVTANINLWFLDFQKVDLKIKKSNYWS